MNKIICFKDLQELQEQLDCAVSAKRPNGFIPRERNLDDIALSMIAEVIEFNEEMKDSHKTWKQKEFNPEKAKEEAVDILFFMLQYINKQKELLPVSNYEYLQRDMAIIFNEFKINEEKADYLTLISYIMTGFMTFAFETLIAYFGKLGMNKKEVIDIYTTKWELNMQRISADWSLKK